MYRNGTFIFYKNTFSSITPGPLQDVVAPADIPQEIHREMLTENMAKLADRMNTRSSAEEVPYVDIFDTVMDDEKKAPKKGNNVFSLQQSTTKKVCVVSTCLIGIIIVPLYYILCCYVNVGLC